MRIRLLKKIIPLLSLLFMTIVWSGQTVSAQEEPTIIKVGYTLNYATLKAPIVVGNEGYGYEYLNRIFEYVDGDYELEFVYCEWTDVMSMVETGEIDIFGPITYTEYNAETYLYTEESFGDNFIFLSTLDENIANYDNYDSIDGATIAVQANNPNEYMLYEFLEENQLEAEVVYFTENDYEKAMEEQGYDLCLCSSLQTFNNLTPAVNLGNTEFYYVTNYDNADLIEEIDQAMQEIDAKEYMYQEKLYLEYYDYSILSDTYITEEEQLLLQEQETYYVGVKDIYGAVCSKNEDGEFEGIAIDAMEMIADIAGIEYVFVEITEDMKADELENLDFSLLTYDEEERRNTTKSNAFCELPYVLVERMAEEGEILDSVGILPYYGITEISQEGYLFGREIIEYDNLADMQDAYNKGMVDSIIITTSNMNLVRGDFIASDFIVTYLDMSLNLCLVYEDGYSEEKVAIFDKIIAQLDETAIQSSVLTYSTSEDTVLSMREILREFPYAIPGTIIALAVMTISFILLFANRKKNYLYQLLNYDRLTGLSSGHKFENDVYEILSHNAEEHYAIVTIDIDHFKYVNDVFGYEIGNIVIQKVGGCISKIAPHALAVARNSSDVFMVLIKQEVPKSQVLEFTDEEKNKLFSELRPYIGDTYKLSFSIGVFDIVDRNLDINFMIDCANMARLQGKSFAHTTINRFDSDMNHKRLLATDLITNMVKGITDHEFVVYYQPKVRLDTRKIVGAEALVRWYKNGTLIPPNDFIPLFEKNGFIGNLDLYVLEEVCIFIDKYPSTPIISVNLSGVTIVKTNITDSILEMVDRYKIPHEKLEFEITETAFIENFEQVVHSLEILRTNGFTISMDDFGVGISSLSRLKKIPIDILKIDREFIWDSVNNDKDEKIVKNIINLAKDLDLETIAEGIETDSHEQMLLEMDCEMGQGYKYSRPLPEAEFLRWINE